MAKPSTPVRKMLLAVGGQEGAGQHLKDPSLQLRRRYRDLGDLPGPEVGGRVDGPGSRRKRTNSGSWKVLSVSSGLRRGKVASLALDPRRPTAQESQGRGRSYSPLALPTTSSQPAGT